MGAFEKEYWVAVLTRVAHESMRNFRPMRHEEYMMQLNFVHLFETMSDQLEKISSCKVAMDFDKLALEYCTSVFHWPFFTERNFETEIRAVWTGSEYELMRIVSSANRESDRLLRLQTLVGRLTRDEINRLPELRTLPPKDPNKTIKELEELTILKRDIEKHNTKVQSKRASLEKMLLDLSTYLNEIRYEWFVRSHQFRSILTSGLSELRNSLMLSVLESPGPPLTKRTRAF